jgi:hypothetical protein
MAERVVAPPDDEQRPAHRSGADRAARAPGGARVPSTKLALLEGCRGRASPSRCAASPGATPPGASRPAWITRQEPRDGAGLPRFACERRRQGQAFAPDGGLVLTTPEGADGREAGEAEPHAEDAGRFGDTPGWSLDAAGLAEVLRFVPGASVERPLWAAVAASGRAPLTAVEPRPSACRISRLFALIPGSASPGGPGASSQREREVAAYRIASGRDCHRRAQPASSRAGDRRRRRRSGCDGRSAWWPSLGTVRRDTGRRAAVPGSPGRAARGPARGRRRRYRRHVRRPAPVSRV